MTDTLSFYHMMICTFNYIFNFLNSRNSFLTYFHSSLIKNVQELGKMFFFPFLRREILYFLGSQVLLTFYLFTVVQCVLYRTSWIFLLRWIIQSKQFCYILCNKTASYWFGIANELGLFLFSYCNLSYSICICAWILQASNHFIHLS